MMMGFRDALLLRHPRSEYVVLEEVSNADTSRRADAIAIALWKSRGFVMHGFERKASRSDWLRELKDPGKAESMFGLCDFWWLVVNDEEIVKDGELPVGWGLLVLGQNGLRKKVEAPRLTPGERPWQFICRLLRRCQDEITATEGRCNGKVEMDRHDIKNEVRDELTAEHEKQIEQAEQRVTATNKTIRDIEVELGVQFRGWNSRDEFKLIKKAIEVARNEAWLEKSLAQLEMVSRAALAVAESRPQPITAKTEEVA